MLLPPTIMMYQEEEGNDILNNALAGIQHFRKPKLFFNAILWFARLSHSDTLMRRAQRGPSRMYIIIGRRASEQSIRYYERRVTFVFFIPCFPIRRSKDGTPGERRESWFYNELMNCVTTHESSNG